MLVTILTTGTQGDTQPYIALGIALQKAGVAVRVAAFENYREFVESYGLACYPIHGDISLIAASQETQSARKADSPLKVLLSFQKLKSLVFDLQKEFYDACQGADAVVYHPGAAIGYFAARQMGIPAILATPFPMTPTGDFPALIFYNGAQLGRAFNRLTHKIFGQIMWSAGSSPIQKFWQQETGSKLQKFASPFPQQITPKNPTVISCSPQVFPRPTDWPENVHMEGYWFLDETTDWTPPAELLAFLNQGEPPVYIGFGSVGDPAEAAKTTEMVAEALRLSGRRGLLATGWNGLSNTTDLSENILVLESAPHAWLFPRMAAVVHHGGAGTTAAGLRAGVPSVIIPHSNDQFAWARRVWELGVGAKPLPRKKLTAERLAAAIQQAMQPEVVGAASEIGARIRSENGAEKAAIVILAALK